MKLVFALFISFLIFPLPISAANFSLQFFGHGTGDIDRIKIPINPPTKADLGGSFTLEWWMRANLADNTGYVSCNQNDGWITGNIIFDRDIYGPGDYGDYGISLGSGRIGFGVSLGGTGTVVCSTRSVADGVWHHVAVTRNSSTGQLRIFIDGQPDGQRTGPIGDISYRDTRTTSFPASDPFLVIGAEKHDAGSTYPSYSGYLDEIRFSNIIRYTSVFSPPQVNFIPDASTVLLYHLDEGTSTTALDSSSNPLPGQIKFGGSLPAGPFYSLVTPPLAPQPSFAHLLTNWLLPRPDLSLDAKVNSLDFSLLATTTPSVGEYFTIAVADEQFCLYSTNATTIQLARDQLVGLNSNHPHGQVVAGSGGFNYGYGGLPGDKYPRWWNWHLDPATTSLAEASIEICDGLPSAVEYGPIDIGTYCPWNGTVTQIGCRISS